MPGNRMLRRDPELEGGVRTARWTGTRMASRRNPVYAENPIENYCCGGRVLRRKGNGKQE